MKLELRGVLYGTKTIKKYKDPQILYSIVDGHKCQKNKLSIGYNKSKDSVYIYHSYDGYDAQMKNIYSGRWYDTKFKLDSSMINKANKSLTIKMMDTDWHNFDTNRDEKKDVKIQIYFSRKGLGEILDVLEKIK